MKTSKSATVKYKINKGFIVQKLGNKTTIFDGEKSQLYTFNQTASFIFDKIKKGLSKEEIIELMIKKYKISNIRAQKDYLGLEKELFAKKIIVNSRN
ncbi:MAG: PqqD family protein [Patescibacteria group bacterium]